MAIPILNHMDFQKSGEIRNVRLHNQAASGVTSPGTGQIVYDSGTVKYYNGSQWQSLGTATGDITAVNITAGNGLSGTSVNTTSGDHTQTLTVGQGDGITVNSGDVAVTAAQTTITSVLNTSLKVGRSASTEYIDFATDNVIKLVANGGEARWNGSAFVPGADGTSDLGSSTKEWEDLYIDGTAYIDTLDLGGTTYTSLGALATLDTVAAAQIDSSAVTAAKIASNAVTTAKINADAVTAAKIADDAVVTANIVDGNVTTAKIAADAITAAKIGDDVINSEHIAAGAIDTEHIAAGQVTTAKIADDAVTGAKLANDITIANDLTVSGNLTVSGSTTTVDSTTVAIADGMLKLAKDQGASADAIDFGIYGQYGVGGTAKFAGIFRDVSATGDAITFFDGLEAEPGTTVNTGGTGYSLADVAFGTVRSGTWNGTAIATAYIANDAITNAKIANDAIDSEHYVNGSIDTAHIGDLQVTTAKIAADAITGAKIADDSINSEHYVADSIDTEHYAAGSVDTTALGSDAVTGAKIADDAVDSEHLVNGSVDNVHLAGSIANSKLANSSITINGSAISLGGSVTTANDNTQLGTAAAKIDVSAMAGNSTASFNHGLASKNVVVQMYDTTSGLIVHADVDHTDNSNISITFANTGTELVALGIGDIRVVVIDAKNGLTDKTVSYS